LPEAETQAFQEGSALGLTLYLVMTVLLMSQERPGKVGRIRKSIKNPELCGSEQPRLRLMWRSKPFFVLHEIYQWQLADQENRNESGYFS